jgi:hypothetical protein
MRFILGIILGILLTVGGAYIYDSITTGRVATAPAKTASSAPAAQRAAGAASPTAEDQRPMVNWDVVSKDLDDLRAGLVQVGKGVQETWKKVTG